MLIGNFTEPNLSALTLDSTALVQSSFFPVGLHASSDDPLALRPAVSVGLTAVGVHVHTVVVGGGGSDTADSAAAGVEPGSFLLGHPFGRIH